MENSSKKMALLPVCKRALSSRRSCVEGPEGATAEESNLVCSVALFNYCILQRIFNYLPHSDLKTSRLVCQLWNEEACRMLRKSSKTVLSTSQKLFAFYWEKFSDKSQLFLNFQLINVHVATPLMEMFFIAYGNRVKHLDLRDSKWCSEDLERLLTKVMPNLEELALHGVIPRDSRLFQIQSKTDSQDKESLRSHNGTIVQKIKYLDLHLYERSLDELPLQLLLVDLLSAFPNVEKIASNESIRKGDMKIKSRKGRFQRILFQTLIAPDGNDNHVSLKYLSHVDIALAPWDDSQVHMLAIKKYPFTYLSIDVLPSVSTNAIISLLTTYKRTLVKLKISFTSWRSTVFPTNQFPLDNLTHLSLDWFNGSLNFLANLSQLKTVILAQVDINETFLQTDSTLFSHDQHLDTLEAYQLAGTSILPLTVQTIAKIFPRLRKFVMGKLTDESMREVFTHMPLLEEFAAIEGYFTDEGVTGIPMFSCRICGKQHLAELCRGVYKEALVNSQRAYPSIASLKNLWKLELRSPKITNLSVFHGAMIVKNLRSLSLWSCDLTFRSLKKLADETQLDYLETTHSFMHRAEICYALKRMKAKKFILNGQEAPKNFQRGTVESEKFLSQFYPVIRRCYEGRRECRHHYNVSACPEQMALYNLVYL